jgi:tRNA-dihydrouridine synthase
MKPHLIVNPASANGRTGRRFDRVARAVREALGEFDCTFTRRRGDAVLVARGACGNPWIFGELRAAERGLPRPPPPGRDEWAEVVLRHVALQV